MLPPALAAWIAQQGHEAEHVSQVGLLGAKDPAIWEHALTRGAVIVTKDEDFSQHRAAADTGPQIVWLRMGNARKALLLQRFEAAFPGIVADLNRGDVLVEVTSG